MAANICGFAVLLVLAVVTALVAHFLLRRSLHALLDEVVKLPPCTTFYTRLLAIGLIFIALSAVLDTQFDLKEDAAFMEYVWKIADGLSSTFSMICLFLTGYLFVATILVAVLRRKSE
ncbi:MAG: hypothetical protein EXS05_04250 [Planctomycetaceae bacterium]|nr:hypothetical protein [Planctomycetaceae bacterium]